MNIDNQTMTTIIIAMIVTIPGIWALINQIKKDKTDLYIAKVERTKERIHELERKRISDIPTNKLFEKMYEQPVILRCGHCGSHNLATNFNCTQCGAPAAKFMEIKNESR